MFGANKAVKGGGSAPPPSTTTPGSAVIIGGTLSVVIPPGVTSISAICLGGGGGGGRGASSSFRGGGGGGGAMCWSNNIPVTPGETLTLVGGAFGAAGSTANGGGQTGGDSYVARGGTILINAKGGSGGLNDNNTGGRTGGQASACTYNGGAYSGGTGGSPTASRGGGGGGAGGYGGAGGVGGGGTTVAQAYGGAGGGDGAGGGASQNPYAANAGFQGGGSNMYGTGGSTGAQVVNNGTNGEPGGRTGPSINTADGNNRIYGGGGGGSTGGTAPFSGGNGFARIIFGPGVSAPSTLCGAYPWTFVTSVTSTTGTITMPAATSFQPGDIAVLVEGATGSTQPGLVVPTGFDSTTQYTAAVGTSRCTMSQKVMLSTDANAVITGMNGSTKNRKTLLIYRQQQGCSIVGTGNGSATNTISGGMVAVPSAPSAPLTNQQLNGRFLQVAVGYTSGNTAIAASTLTFAPAGATTTAFLHPSSGLNIKVAITPIATLVTVDNAAFNSGQAANNIVMVRSTLGR